MRKGWEYKKLNEVCEKGASNIVINKLTDNSGEYPLFGASGLVKNIDFFHQDKPYIGIVKDGAGVGRVNIYPAYSSLVGTMQYIFPKEGYSIDFIKYFLVKLDLSHCVSGATIPHIYFKDYGKENIPTPSLDTQLAIVSELDKINELIRLKKEQLKDFDNLAQSLFYEMFGDPVENEKGWEVKKLKDISREIGDGLHGTPEYSEVDTGCYFINGNNLENGTIVIKENTKMVSEKTKTKHYIEMDDFTILVSINGTLGKVAFYNGENVILGKSACYIKLEAYNDKKYIFELLKSDYFKRCAENECTGTTIRNVSLKSMRNFRCPLPPLPLQRLFAQRIEQIEREKSEVQKSIQDLETLLASRMQYWFE